MPTPIVPSFHRINQIYLFDELPTIEPIESFALLKVDFGSRSQSWVPNFYSTFVYKSTFTS